MNTRYLYNLISLLRIEMPLRRHRSVRKALCRCTGLQESKILVYVILPDSVNGLEERLPGSPAMYDNCKEHRQYLDLRSTISLDRVCCMGLT